MIVSSPKRCAPCRSSRPIIATPPRLSSTKISACTFDGNRYCVPPRYVGRQLTVKADSCSVTIYDQHQEIVCYARCWRRGQTFGAERFQKELFAQMAAAAALGRATAPGRCCSDRPPKTYLRRLADTDRSLARQVRELLELIREYGPEAVAAAIRKPMPRAPSAPTTSPTSCASSNRGARCSRRFGSEIRS